ncbi:unnamed protein product, partial [Cladocopium goreaui]
GRDTMASFTAVQKDQNLANFRGVPPCVQVQSPPRYIMQRPHLHASFERQLPMPGPREDQNLANFRGVPPCVQVQSPPRYIMQRPHLHTSFERQLPMPGPREEMDQKLIMTRMVQAMNEMADSLQELRVATASNSGNLDDLRMKMDTLVGLSENQMLQLLNKQAVELAAIRNKDMGDGGDGSVPSKPLKAPAEEPPEDPLKDESKKAPQPEDTPKPAEPSAEEVRPPEATTASAPEPAPPESAPAAPAASAEPRMRRPPTPPRPRRKLPRSEAEANAPPATDPRRRPVSDDDEVVVVSVNGRDAGDMDEDAKLGEQMRQALDASLAATRREAAREEPAQMALPVVPMPEPVANEAKSEEEAPDAKRLAAAAAAARGARGLQGRESDSDSDSEGCVKRFQNVAPSASRTLRCRILTQYEVDPADAPVALPWTSCFSSSSDRRISQGPLLDLSRG